MLVNEMVFQFDCCVLCVFQLLLLSKKKKWIYFYSVLPKKNCLFARDFRSKIEIERQILMYEEKPQSQKAL